MDNTKRDIYFLSNQRVLDPVGFKLPGEPHVQSFVGLGVGGLPGIWEASQEVGRRNRPPWLRKRLLPKSVHLVLGVLGVSDPLPVDLEGLNARYG